MSNPLWDAFGGSVRSNIPNPMQMIQQFKNFQKSFKGDPKAEVMKLLQNGQMTQEQFNQLQGLAEQFKQILNQ